jgi:DNA mismatch repair protein MutL
MGDSMSGKIQVLDSIVANRIAAGEVVERPASVVKELVENALDAGARKITVDVEKGGKRLIRVTDDGAGMERDDAELSLQRHATSKVRTTEDIGHISTLGFRGEALPSIASVSLFKLSTRSAGCDEGTTIRVEGGAIKDITAAGIPVGTEIEVRTLFSHVPARRKFLKTDATEWGHIESLLRRCALCHPQVHWEWRHNAASWNRYPTVESLHDRIFQLFGKAWCEDTLPFTGQASRQGWSLTGRVSAPGNMRSSRNEQYWFINGRPVVHAGLVYALQEGFGAFISRGRYPVGVFFLGLPLEDVDVNVHPAKREVRLRNETAVRRMISEATNQLLRDWTEAQHQQKNRATTAAKSTHAATSAPSLARELQQNNPLTPPQKVELRIDVSEPEQVEWQSDAESALGSTLRQVPANETSVETPDAESDDTADEPGDSWLKLIGKTEPGLMLAENEEGIVLVHIQAAFERIYFEEMMERFAHEATESQALLIPVNMEFSPELAAFVNQAQGVLELAGISIASLGGNAFMVDALPAAVASRDPERFVRDVVNTLSESGDRKRTASKLQNEEVAAALARHMSRGRRTEGEAELNWLLSRLHRCDLPYARPDGRPTMILLSQNEFKRRFQVD